MHEMAVVRDIVDIAVRYAEKASAERVSAVYLTIGYGRDVVEKYMDGLFAHLARDTVAADAQLVIRRTPLMACCNRCAETFPINLYKPATWCCPRCGRERDYRIVSGQEFTIDRIVVAGCRAKAAG